MAKNPPERLSKARLPNGFCQIGFHSQALAERGVPAQACRGEHDYLRVLERGILFDSFSQREAIDVGHMAVRQHKRIRRSGTMCFMQGGEGDISTLEERRFHAPSSEQLAHDPAVGCIIVDHEYLQVLETNRYRRCSLNLALGSFDLYCELED